MEFNRDQNRNKRARSSIRIRIGVDLLTHHLDTTELIKSRIKHHANLTNNEMPEYDDVKEWMMHEAKATSGEVAEETQKVVVQEAYRVHSRMLKIDGGIFWLMRGKDKDGRSLAAELSLTKHTALHKAAITHLNHLESKWPSGLGMVQRMTDLVYATTEYEVCRMEERIFKNKPCKRMFTLKQAHELWDIMRHNEDPHAEKCFTEKQLKYAALLEAVVSNWEKGISSIDTAEDNVKVWPDGGSSRQRALAVLMTKALRSKEFIGLHRNRFTNDKVNFGSTVRAMEAWLDKHDTMDTHTLDALSIPLCMKSETRLCTKLWIEIEDRMISNLKRYLENVGCEAKDVVPTFPSEFCSICLDAYTERNPASKLTCGHTFHRECGETWLKKKGTCPTCRTEAYFDCLKNDFIVQKGAKFNHGQRHAVESIVNNDLKFAVINGAGGTGKSEMATVLAEFEVENSTRFPDLGRSVFVAPTGAAAMNMANRLPRHEFQVNSIHSWILTTLNQLQLGKNSYGTIPFLFIDEAAMVSTWLFAAVLEMAIRLDIKRIVLMGDRFQLPPVGGVGTVFASSCIAANEGCEVFKKCVFLLQENFRSNIPGILHILQRIRELMEAIELQQLKMGTDDDEGLADATEAVKLLHLFNPRRIGHADDGKRRFVKGDAVMCLKNIKIDRDNGKVPELVVGNGSIGEVLDAEYDKVAPHDVVYMCVRFGEAVYEYPVRSWYAESIYHIGTKNDDDMDALKRNARNIQQISLMFEKLSLASMQTVHKYQGSQKPYVITSMYQKKRDVKEDSNPPGFHSLNLLYTAASRAQTEVYFVFDHVTLKHFMDTPTVAPADRQLIARLALEFGAGQPLIEGV